MRKLVSFVMIVYLVFALSGCAERPKVSEENGIYYAQSETDNNIDKILNSPEREFVFSDEELYEYHKNIGKNERHFYIDAVVKNINLSEVSMLTVNPFENMFDKQKVISLFFDGSDNVCDITEKVNQKNITAEGTEKAVSVKMISDSRLCLETQDKNKWFSRSVDSSFYYGNNELNKKYANILSKEFQKQNSYDVPTYTVDTAIEDVENIMKNLGFEGIQIVSCTSYYNQEEGYYDIEFTPMVGGLPLVFNNYEQNTDNIVDVLGTVTIGSDGIGDLQVNNCLWKIIEKKKVECISLDKLEQVLEQYVLSGDIECSENIVYTKCELQYLPTTDDWKNVILTPVWRIYVPTEERNDIDMDEVYRKNLPLDICINAISGKIEFCY